MLMWLMHCRLTSAVAHDEAWALALGHRCFRALMKGSPAKLTRLHNPLHTQQSQIPPHSGQKQLCQVELIRQLVRFEILCAKCRHSGLQDRDRHGRADR